MIKSRGGVFALAGAVLVLAFLAVAVHSVTPTRHVAVPRDDATPELIVTAYTDALDAHDCDTAEALTTADFKATFKPWCDDVASLSKVVVTHHIIESPRESGRSSDEEVANVPVTFDLRWRSGHDDGSMEEGLTDWGYLLVRASPKAPWRIFDEGVG